MSSKLSPISYAVMSLVGRNGASGPQLVEMFERRAEGVPHRTRAIVLELSLVRRLIDAHRAWIDDVERELGQATAAAVEAPGSTW